MRRHCRYTHNALAAAPLLRTSRISTCERKKNFGSRHILTMQPTEPSLRVLPEHTQSGTLHLDRNLKPWGCCKVEVSRLGPGSRI